MVKPLRNALLAGSVAAVLLAAASPAAAADFCVDNDLVPAATCQEHWFPMNGANLQAAAERAADPPYPGLDRVVIGAGVLSISSTVTIAPPAGEPLDIVGAGSAAGQTELANDIGSGVALDFFPAGVTDSSISNLAISVPAVTNPLVGMRAHGGRVHNVRFRVLGDSESNHAGLWVEGAEPTRIADSEFEVVGIGNETLGLRVRNNSTVTRSGFSAQPSYHPGQFGAIVESTTGSGTPRAVFSQTSFRDFDLAISQLDGQLTLQEVLIDTGPIEGVQTGISVKDLSGGTQPVELDGDGLTVVGEGFGSVGVTIDSTAGDDSIDVQISDMVVAQSGAGSADLSCVDNTASPVTFGLGHALLSPGDLTAAGANGCALTDTGILDRINSPPKFLDAANRDFRPMATSPAIDAGSDAAVRAPDENGLQLDLGKRPRFADGDGDGVARIDIGAFEFQAPVAPPAVVQTLTITLGKPVGKFKLNRKKGRKKLKRTGFAFTTARKKPRIPLTANLDATLTLKLAKYRAGYVKGLKCVKRKPAGRRRAKRCDLPLKGSQTIAVKAGTSYLTFGGKLGRSRLTPGKYRLIVSSSSLNDAKKSILNVIR